MDIKLITDNLRKGSEKLAVQTAAQKNAARDRSPHTVNFSQNGSGSVFFLLSYLL